MSERHRPGLKNEAIYRSGWVGKNAMALKEMKTNEEPLPGVGQTYIQLHHDTCFPL